MKITIKNKEKEEQSICHHQVGNVYRDGSKTYYLVVRCKDNKVGFVQLNHGYEIDYQPKFLNPMVYNTLDEMDKDNPNDIPVDAELIVSE